MKKTYSTPTIEIVTLQQHGIICTSQIRSIDGNAGLSGGGSDANYTGGARVKGQGSYDVWADDWSK
jgi:hypothetical protein